MAYCDHGRTGETTAHPAEAVTSRFLTVLGTASHISTRKRAVGGYALHWDDQVILFDPGEGFQRQCLLAGVPVGRATAVCITHFHGDHCLGLPGIVHRRALSGSRERLPVYFPAAGRNHFDHLLNASAYDGEFVEPRPVHETGVVGALGASTLSSQALEHGVPTIGYRVESNQVMAFVMDTVPCDGAAKLAADADLLVCEATFLNRDERLATEGMHLTARQAAELAADSRARRLVLSHFSSRYRTTAGHAEEAGRVHGDVVVPDDLSVVEVPARRRKVAR